MSPISGITWVPIRKSPANISNYKPLWQNLPAHANSRYRIGSISKTFTTVLIMKAIEAGKLSLNETLDKYFPQLPESGEITVEQLLYHRSGIHSFTGDEAYTGVWSSEQLTMKITITREKDRLEAQGTGQPAFPLEATGKDRFSFEQAGIALELSPSEKKMVLKQGGGSFVFMKEVSGQ